MGQRSQIYIAYETQNNDKTGTDLKLMARYYQWNYGSRMVSRAVGLMDWIKENRQYLNFNEDKMIRVADVNFDFRDVVISSDIIEDVEKYNEVEGDRQRDIFVGQDNNDGKLFIFVPLEGNIQYAFTDYYFSKVMTAEEYMDWGGIDNDEYHYETEEDAGSNYSANCKHLKEYSLMSENKLHQLLIADYANVPSLDHTDKDFAFYLENTDTKEVLGFVTVQCSDDGKSIDASLYKVQDEIMSLTNEEVVALNYRDYLLYSTESLAWAAVRKLRQSNAFGNSDPTFFRDTEIQLLPSNSDYFKDIEGYPVPKVLKNLIGAKDKQNSDREFKS